MTYAEFLKAQGASEEEIKILVNAVSERAFAKMQEQAESDKKAALAEYEGRVSKWYADEIKPNSEKTAKELASAKARAAAREAEIKSLQDQGLLEVAQVQDARAAAAAASAGGDPEPFDPKKYNLVTQDSLAPFAAAQGKGMVKLATLMREHEKLGLPECDWNDLYEQSAKANKQLPDYWADTYKVSDVRAKKSAEAAAAHDAKVAADAIAKYKVDNGSLPGAAAPRPSGFAFTKKTGSAGDAKLSPWLVGDKEKEDRAVDNALRKISERSGTA